MEKQGKQRKKAKGRNLRACFARNHKEREVMKTYLTLDNAKFS
jgi:hypothetical protein